MIAALFGFRGQLGRLAFMGWNVAGMAIVAVLATLFMVLGTALAGPLSRLHTSPAMFGLLMAVTCAAAGIWMTLALATKRIRDAGFAPLPLMIGASVLMMIDAYVLTRFTGVRFFAPFAQYTPLGGMLVIAWVVFLNFWPSAPDSDADTPPQRHPDAARAHPMRAQFGPKP